MKLSYFLTRPKAETNSSIYARICYSGYKFKYYIPESINPKFWSTRTREAKQSEKFKEYPEFNQRLRDIASDIGDTLLNYKNQNNGEIPNPDTFRELLNLRLKKKEAKKIVSPTFFTFFQDLIERSKKGLRLNPKTGKPISLNTLKSYITTQNHILEYSTKQKRKIDFQSIDLEFYSDFVEFLTRKLKLSANTIGKDIKIIKLVMNEATERDLNTNKAFKSKLFIKVREDSDSVYLSENELREIESLDLSTNKRLESVRDLFLIGCYTGLRYSDYSVLNSNHIKDGFIEVKQTKTGQSIVIPVHQTVKRIIKKYNGTIPQAISNQKTNDYLKEIAKKIKLLKKPVTITFTKGGLQLSETFEKSRLITTHTARRTFATNEYLAGTPAITIMAITGHKTEKAFLSYIKLTPNEHAKLMKQHWDIRNSLKAV